MKKPHTGSSVAFAYTSRFLDHDTGPQHPERPQRLEAIVAQLTVRGLADRLLSLEFEPCDVAAMQLVHGEDYLNRARQDIESGQRVLSTGDTNVCPESWEIAKLAAGAGIAAVNAVCERRVRSAFCAVRPPGHHASPDRGMGFCVLNNIAMAVRHAQNNHGIERALVVDWDVHHGNGTQDVFYEDESVLFFSTHQWPLYPGTGDEAETGSGAGSGTTINVPLSAGAGRQAVFSAFESRLLPAVAEFRPDAVFISAGFDSRAGDPLGGFELTDRDFFDLTKLMQRVADEFAEGRIVSLLEGGYSVSGLANAVAAHVSALLGDEQLTDPT